MLRDIQLKFIWVGIFVLGLILFGMPLVYAGDIETDPADVAYQEVVDQRLADLEEIAANRDAVIEELVQTWFMDEPGWEDEFRVALSQANDSELLAIQNAKSYAEVQAILSGGTPDDFNAESMDSIFALGDINRDFVFTPVNPCRIIDTRLAGGKIPAGSSRNFFVHGNTSTQGGTVCTAPSGVPRAVHINITAVNSEGNGYLTVWPTGTARPLASIINYSPTDKTDPIANAFSVKTGYALGLGISIFAHQTTDVVADVMGYYYKTEELGGADFSGGEQGVNLSAAATTVRSVNVSAPASGKVIVNASGYFLLASAAVDTGRCSITNGTAVDYNHLIIAGERTDGGSMSFVPFASTRGFNVSAGNTTFRLVCDEAAGTVVVGDSSITAVWVPRTY